MNIASFEEGPWSYYQSLDLEFRYALGKVLGTQDHPTLRLVSYRCVLYLNLTKSTLNTCIYTHTHTLAYFYTYIHGIFHPNTHILINPKQERAKA